MKSFARCAIVSGVVIAVIGTPTSASAQSQLGERAYQGLFGGSGYDPTVRHRLEFGFKLVEAYDDDAPSEFPGNPIGVPPGTVPGNSSDFVVSGYSTMLEGTAEYNWRGSRVEFGASAASVLRFFTSSDQRRNVTAVGSVGTSIDLTPSSKLFVNQSVSYSPSYLYSLFAFDSILDPGDLPPVGADYQIVDIESFSYSTTLSLTQRLSARNSFTATADYNFTDFSEDQTFYHDLRSTGIRGDFTRNFSRRFSMLAGYFFRAGDYEESPDTTQHGVEVGLDYTKPLSATRSATVGFRVGGSNLTGGQFEGPEGPQTSDYSLAYGSVYAGYQFGRSWRTDGEYRRGIDYVAGFPDPVVTSGLTASVSGALSSRLDVTASFGYSNGESAFNVQSYPFDSYTGQASMQFGLTREIACYFQYLYYEYRFNDDATLLLPGAPKSMERNGIRAGLTLWVPAFRK